MAIIDYRTPAEPPMRQRSPWWWLLLGPALGAIVGAVQGVAAGMTLMAMGNSIPLAFFEEVGGLLATAGAGTGFLFGMLVGLMEGGTDERVPAGWLGVWVILFSLIATPPAMVACVKLSIAVPLMVAIPILTVFFASILAARMIRPVRPGSNDLISVG